MVGETGDCSRVAEEAPQRRLVLCRGRGHCMAFCGFCNIFLRAIYDGVMCVTVLVLVLNRVARWVLTAGDWDATPPAHHWTLGAMAAAAFFSRLTRGASNPQNPYLSFTSVLVCSMSRTPGPARAASCPALPPPFISELRFLPSYTPPPRPATTLRARRR